MPYDYRRPRQGTSGRVLFDDPELDDLLDAPEPPEDEADPEKDAANLATIERVLRSPEFQASQQAQQIQDEAAAQALRGAPLPGATGPLPSAGETGAYYPPDVGEPNTALPGLPTYEARPEYDPTKQIPGGDTRSVESGFIPPAMRKAAPVVNPFLARVVPMAEQINEERIQPVVQPILGGGAAFQGAGSTVLQYFAGNKEAGDWLMKRAAEVGGIQALQEAKDVNSIPVVTGLIDPLMLVPFGPGELRAAAKILDTTLGVATVRGARAAREAVGAQAVDALRHPGQVYRDGNWWTPTQASDVERNVVTPALTEPLQTAKQFATEGRIGDAQVGLGIRPVGPGEPNFQIGQRIATPEGELTITEFSGEKLLKAIDDAGTDHWVLRSAARPIVGEVTQTPPMEAGTTPPPPAAVAPVEAPAEQAAPVQAFDESGVALPPRANTFIEMANIRDELSASPLMQAVINDVGEKRASEIFAGLITDDETGMPLIDISKLGNEINSLTTPDEFNALIDIAYNIKMLADRQVQDKARFPQEYGQQGQLLDAPEPPTTASAPSSREAAGTQPGSGTPTAAGAPSTEPVPSNPALTKAESDVVRNGAASYNGTNVKVVAHPAGEGFAVEVIKGNGGRQTLPGEAVPLEQAQQRAIEVLRSGQTPTSPQMAAQTAPSAGAEPTPTDKQGAAVTVMGRPAEVVEAVVVNGLEHDLYRFTDDGATEAAVRIYDIDAGEVVTLRAYNTLDEAKAAFDKAVASARADKGSDEATYQLAQEQETERLTQLGETPRGYDQASAGITAVLKSKGVETDQAQIANRWHDPLASVSENRGSAERIAKMMEGTLTPRGGYTPLNSVNSSMDRLADQRFSYALDKQVNPGKVDDLADALVKKGAPAVRRGTKQYEELVDQIQPAAEAQRRSIERQGLQRAIAELKSFLREDSYSFGSTLKQAEENAQQMQAKARDVLALIPGSEPAQQAMAAADKVLERVASIREKFASKIASLEDRVAELDKLDQASGSDYIQLPPEFTDGELIHRAKSIVAPTEKMLTAPYSPNLVFDDKARRIEGKEGKQEWWSTGFFLEFGEPADKIKRLPAFKNQTVTDSKAAYSALTKDTVFDKEPAKPLAVDQSGVPFMLIVTDGKRVVPLNIEFYRYFTQEHPGATLHLGRVRDGDATILQVRVGDKEVGLAMPIFSDVITKAGPIHEALVAKANKPARTPPPERANQWDFAKPELRHEYQSALGLDPAVADKKWADLSPEEQRAIDGRGQEIGKGVAGALEQLGRTRQELKQDSMGVKPSPEYWESLLPPKDATFTRETMPADRLAAWKAADEAMAAEATHISKQIDDATTRAISLGERASAPGVRRATKQRLAGNSYSTGIVDSAASRAMREEAQTLRASIPALEAERQRIMETRFSPDYELERSMIQAGEKGVGTTTPTPTAPEPAIKRIQRKIQEKAAANPTPKIDVGNWSVRDFDSGRYLQATYNGQQWWANGFMAELGEPATRIARSKYVTDAPPTERAPSLDQIIREPENTDELTPVAKVGTSDNPLFIFTRAEGTPVAVKPGYFSYFQGRYPDLTFWTKPGKQGEPVTVRSDGKTIGVVMPMYIDEARIGKEIERITGKPVGTLTSKIEADIQTLAEGEDPLPSPLPDLADMSPEMLERVSKLSNMLEYDANHTESPERLAEILEQAKGLPFESRIANAVAYNKFTDYATFTKAINNPEARKMAPDSYFESLKQRRNELSGTDQVEAPAAPEQAPTSPEAAPEEAATPGVAPEEPGVIKSKSGRVLTPPKLNPMTSDRVATNNLRKIDAWLISEAKKEVSGDDYLATLVDGMNPKNVSPADRDMLNEIIFGDIDGVDLPITGGGKAPSAPTAGAPPDQVGTNPVKATTPTTPDTTPAPTGEVVTVDDVHNAADDLGIPWNDDKAFMAWTANLPGVMKAKLDDMTPEELQLVIDALNNGERPHTNVHPEADQSLHDQVAQAIRKSPAARGTEPSPGAARGGTGQEEVGESQTGEPNASVSRGTEEATGEGGQPPKPPENEQPPAAAPAAEPGQPQLPPSLAGAKPRYNIGSTAYELEFESDLDKALFIIAQTSPSAHEAEYLQWLHEQLPGMSEANIIAAGTAVKARIKDLAMAQPEGGMLKVPKSRQTKPTPDDKVIEQAAQTGAQVTPEVQLDPADITKAKIDNQQQPVDQLPSSPTAPPAGQSPVAGAAQSAASGGGRGTGGGAGSPPAGSGTPAGSAPPSPPSGTTPPPPTGNVPTGRGAVPTSPKFSPEVEKAITYASNKTGVEEAEIRMAITNSAVVPKTIGAFRGMWNKAFSPINSALIREPNVQLAYVEVMRYLQTQGVHVEMDVVMLEHTALEAFGKKAIEGEAVPDLTARYRGPITTGQAMANVIGRLWHVYQSPGDYLLTPLQVRAVAISNAMQNQDLDLSKNLGMSIGEFDDLYLQHSFKDPDKASKELIPFASGRAGRIGPQHARKLTTEEFVEFAQKHNLEIEFNMSNLWARRLSGTAKQRTNYILVSSVAQKVGGKKLGYNRNTWPENGRLIVGQQAWSVPVAIQKEVEHLISGYTTRTDDKALEQAIDITKGMLLNLDFSVGGGRQAFVAFMADPIAWSRAYGQAVGLIGGGDQNWLIWFNQHGPEMADATQHGVQFRSMNVTDVAEGLPGDPKPFYERGRFNPIGRINDLQFKMIMPAMKLETYHTFFQVLKAARDDKGAQHLIHNLPVLGAVSRKYAGKLYTMTDDELKNVAAEMVNNGLGGIEWAKVGESPGVIRKLAVLTESWTRGQVGLFTSAPQATAEGFIARRLLMNEIGIAIMASIGLSMALSQQMPELDPRSRYWLMIKGKDGYVDILPQGRWFRGFAQMISGRKQGEYGGDKGMIEQRANALWDLVQGSFGNVPQTLAQLARQEDYYGNPITDPAWLYFIKNQMPIIGQGVARGQQQGLDTNTQIFDGVANFWGWNFNPYSPANKGGQRVPGLDALRERFLTAADLVSENDPILKMKLSEYATISGEVDRIAWDQGFKFSKELTEKERALREHIEAEYGKQVLTNYNLAVRQIEQGLYRDNPELQEYYSKLGKKNPLPASPTPTRTPTPTSTPTATVQPNFQGGPTGRATPTKGYTNDRIAAIAGQVWGKTNADGSALSYEQFSATERRAIDAYAGQLDAQAMTQYGREWRNLTPTQQQSVVNAVGPIQRIQPTPTPQRSPTATATPDFYQRILVGAGGS